MSAMHWEARRRQHALDRRMARDKEQVLQRSSETSSNEAKSDTTPEPAAGDQCPHCKKTAVHHGAKVPNRYSSLQYSQQW